MTRARDVLYVAGIRGDRTPGGYAGTGSSSARSCRTMRTATRNRRARKRPIVWPQPPRGSRSPRRTRAGRGRSGAGRCPDWLIAAGAVAVPRARSRFARRARWPSPTASGLRQPPHGAVAARRGPARVRGRAVHRCCSVLPGVPPTDRARLRRCACSRRDFRDDPELAAIDLARRRAPCSPTRRSPDLFGPNSRAEVAHRRAASRRARAIMP